MRIRVGGQISTRLRPKKREVIFFHQEQPLSVRAYGGRVCQSISANYEARRDATKGLFGVEQQWEFAPFASSGRIASDRVRREEREEGRGGGPLDCGNGYQPSRLFRKLLLVLAPFVSRFTTRLAQRARSRLLRAPSAASELPLVLFHDALAIEFPPAVSPLVQDAAPDLAPAPRGHLPAYPPGVASARASNRDLGTSPCTAPLLPHDHPRPRHLCRVQRPNRVRHAVRSFPLLFSGSSH